MNDVKPMLAGLEDLLTVHASGHDDLDFQWDLLDAMISGRSAIDVPRLDLDSLDDAEGFLASYGYDWSRSEHRAEVERIRDEAISFLNNELLNDEHDLLVDDRVHFEKDVRNLLLWASTEPGSDRQRWSCVVLRLMHTFAHVGSYFQEHYEELIRDQISARIRQFIHEGPDGPQLGQGPDAIPLVAFDFRGRKSRVSTAMKLLQKAENVAADVFDWVGVRFVTHERFDSLLVARWLRQHHVVMFAHVKPGRSRNTLIDMERVREDILDVDRLVATGQLHPEARLDEMRRRVANHPYPGSPVPSYNPYSSLAYHSIQFTASHQVRVPNAPAHLLKRMLRDANRHERLLSLVDRFGLSTESRFFFPFEVQILDRLSYDRSRHGLASHLEYKRRQREAVKERVLGTLLRERVTGAG